MARFSEAILDYMADEQRASSGQVTFSQFEGHIFSSFDQLFNVWLMSKESRVSKHTCARILHCYLWLGPTQLLYIQGIYHILIRNTPHFSVATCVRRLINILKGTKEQPLYSTSTLSLDIHKIQWAEVGRVQACPQLLAVYGSFLVKLAALEGSVSCNAGQSTLSPSCFMPPWCIKQANTHRVSHGPCTWYWLVFNTITLKRSQNLHFNNYLYWFHLYRGIVVTGKHSHTHTKLVL